MGQKPRILKSFPEVLATWDFARNPSDIDPGALSRLDDANNPKGFWWVCTSVGHSYPMSISSRIKGSSCLVCANKFVPGQNDLLTRFPELEKFWPSGLSWANRPNDLQISSQELSLELQCPIHSLTFEIAIRSLVRYLRKGDPPCELCRARASVAGNSIFETRSDLLALWDMERNLTTPDLVTPGSQIRFWWVCVAGHDSWEASPYEVSSGTRMCPCCPGSHKLVQGCNDLATTHPNIASRWDFSRNKVTPSEVKIGVNKKFFFLCDNSSDHHPEMYLPNLKKNPFACTSCWNEPVQCKVNDFGCLYPDLLPFFLGGDANADPHKLRPGDERTFLWRCLNGEEHSFERTLATMTNRRSRRTCPVCLNRVIIPGLNSLQDIAPDVAREWDWDLNEQFRTLRPDNVSPRSGYEVFWHCPVGHDSYKAAIWNRTVAETKCPNCANFGFKKSEPALLYLIERGESSEFKAGRKIGISNLTSSKTRIRHWSYQGFSLLHSVTYPKGSLIQDLEDSLLNGWIRGELGMGQYLSSDEILGGFTETFAPDFPSNAEVISKINSTLELLIKRDI